MALYASFDVCFPDDPKVVEAGPMAELAYVRCVLRGRQLLTDGFIDKRIVGRWLAGLPGSATKHMRALVEVGLVVEVDGGWRIPSHVWARWNPTAEQVDAKRKAEADRKKAYRAARSSQRDTGGTPSDVLGVSGVRDRQPESESESESESEPMSVSRQQPNEVAAPPDDDDDGLIASIVDARAARLGRPNPTPAWRRTVAASIDRTRAAAAAAEGHDPATIDRLVDHPAPAAPPAVAGPAQPPPWQPRPVPDAVPMTAAAAHIRAARGALT